MRNILLTLIALCVAGMIACKKDDPATPAPGKPSSPYYFKFKFDGTDYDLDADFPQYILTDGNAAGGYEVANATFFPFAGIRFTWPQGDTVTEHDIMGLAGKTLYFSDTTIEVEVSFSKDNSSPTWYSTDTADKNFFVKINSVTFLKNDTSFNPLKTYVIKGTCNAVMDDYNFHSVAFSGGEFNFVICRRDL